MLEHKSISIADQIFEKLEYDILCGEYAKGEILTEGKLSERLGVSRTPIREALRRLEQEHILEATGKGAVVIGIGKEDIAVIYEIRHRIEGMAARMAAQRVTPQDAQALKDLVELQEFYVGKSDSENIRNLDSRFHNKIYMMCGSIPLGDALTELHKKILKYRRTSVQDMERAAHSVEEHRKLYHAIIARDAVHAEEYAISHINHARDHICNTL